MAESADATDLKSVVGDNVRVRPPLAPQRHLGNSGCFVFLLAMQSEYLGAGPLSPHNEHSGDPGCFVFLYDMQFKSLGAGPLSPHKEHSVTRGVLCFY